MGDGVATIEVTEQQSMIINAIIKTLFAQTNKAAAAGLSGLVAALDAAGCGMPVDACAGAVVHCLMNSTVQMSMATAATTQGLPELPRDAYRQIHEDLVIRLTSAVHKAVTKAKAERS
jgi:hypothetical protein